MERSFSWLLRAVVDAIEIREPQSCFVGVRSAVVDAIENGFVCLHLCVGGGAASKESVVDQFEFECK